MRRLTNTLIALAAAGTLLGATPALARHHHQYDYRTCRHSSGTAGLIGGGAGGALLGHAIIGGPVGVVASAVGGAFGGRAIDRRMTAHRRCRVLRR